MSGLIKSIITTNKAKKELQSKHSEMLAHSHQLFKVWDEMLKIKTSIKIIEADSEQKLDAAYGEFKKNDNGQGRLHSIWSIEKKDFKKEGGKYIYFLEFKEFILRDGVSYDEYSQAINEYDDYNKKLKKFESENNL